MCLAEFVLDYSFLLERSYGSPSATLTKGLLIVLACRCLGYSVLFYSEGTIMENIHS